MALVQKPHITPNDRPRDGLFLDCVGSSLGRYRLSSIIAKVTPLVAPCLKDLGRVATAEQVTAFGQRFKDAIAAHALFEAIGDVSKIWGEIVEYRTVRVDPHYRAFTKLVDKVISAMLSVLYAGALIMPSCLKMADPLDVAHNAYGLYSSVDDLLANPDPEDLQLARGLYVENPGEAVTFAKRLSVLKGAKAALGLLPVAISASTTYTGFQLSATAAAVNGLAGAVLGLAGDLYGNSSTHKVNFFAFKVEDPKVVV